MSSAIYQYCFPILYLVAIVVYNILLFACRVLAGRTIFITGASRGIGKAIALKAAQDGANIVIAAKTAEPHPKLPGTIFTAAKEGIQLQDHTCVFCHYTCSIYVFRYELLYVCTVYI